MQKTITTLVGAIKLMLERIPEPPDANCSCHISPPCNDCVDYAGAREAFEYAKGVLAEVQSDTRHGVDSLAQQLELERGTLLAETERKQQLQGQVDALLVALSKISRMTMSMYASAGEAMSEAKRIAHEAIATAQPAQIEQVAPGLYAILYRDNWDGEGYVYHLLAEYKDGKWYAEDSGKELLEYEGDAILRVWPLTNDKAQPTIQPVGWGMSKKTIAELAAELIRGAECMGDDETELALEIRMPGTVRDDDGNLNAGPVLAISDAEYPEEGVYPIDPHNPTAGREPEAQQQAEPRCACGDSFTSDAVCANCLAAAEPVALEPVEGDLLPAIGDTVLIHLSRPDGWFPHRVVGYYAWGDLSGSKHLYRVFVRVVDAEGYTNARPLDAIRRLGDEAAQPPAVVAQDAVVDSLCHAFANAWNKACRQVDVCAMLAAAQKNPRQTFAEYHLGKPFSMPDALADIATERRRQIEQEGWTPEHDDAHSDGQMATAAACYAISAHSPLRYKRIIMPSWWPWDSTWWKPSTTRRDLVKAGALIAAEIERLDRAEQKGGA